MPFDLTPPDPDLDILARMELLGEIAAKSMGSQEHFRSCLWSEAYRHPQLQALLRPFVGPRSDKIEAPASRQQLFAAGDLFGIRWLFGPADIEDKRTAINERIAALKAAIAAKTTTKQKEYA